MTYFVYLIGNYKKSKVTTYAGYTNNLKNRLLLHNTGRGAKFTKGRKWKLIFFKKYNTKKKAMIEEYKLKYDRKLRNKLKNKFLNKNQ